VSVYFETAGVTLHHGDCIDVMRAMPDASVDSIVTDPPYGLEFMGKGWDAPWRESDVNADAGFHGGGVSATKNAPSFTGSTNPKCLVCKGTRRGRRDGTAKVAVCLCDDGGRFPNVRAIEMRAFQAWCEQWTVECLRVLKPGGHMLAFGGTRTWHRLAVAVEDAGFEIRDSIAWMYGSGFPKSMNMGDGMGTALKPAFEPIVVARKPLAGTVAANVLAHGTGALNIDGCRISAAPGDVASVKGTKRSGGIMGASEPRDSASVPHDSGRFPANVVLDEHAAQELDGQSGVLTSGAVKSTHTRSTVGGNGHTHGAMAGVTGPERDASSGGASRFFYTAKADSAERPVVNGIAHPTVKPLDLMRWLVRLVTPRGGVVLEPFAGSGTTLEAAVLEGFRAIGIEREADYLPLIEKRLDKPHAVRLDIFGGTA
jgi:DNA modification methylase